MRGQGEQQRVPQQGGRLEIRVVLGRRCADQRDVQAALAQALELLGGLLVVQRHVNTGAFPAQGPKGGGQDARVHGVGDVPDAQAALLAAAQSPAEVLQPVRVPQQGAGLGQEDPAVGGQPDALLAALEEGEVQVLLELGDLPAEG